MKSVHFTYPGGVVREDRNESRHNPSPFKIKIDAPPIDPLKEHKVKKYLVADILKKYNLHLTAGAIKAFYTHSPNILRELLVFGEHEHIIDAMRAKSVGTY